ncbi:MAG: 50S ribosomal protein L10 [Chloroflexi bacterium]|nr:50S ribosomal protein L10 [Chloroflexota bacterium]
MAFTKQQKEAMVAKYEQWLRDSQAVFMTEYNRMGMKDIDALRAKAREAGGELHVVKNRLLLIALDRIGIQHDAELEQTTLVGFAFGEVPAMAKVFSEAAKADIYELKGGFLNGRQIGARDITALAELPPLPVMQARLLGVLAAPATQLVRTLVEPARQVAAVIKAYSEKEAPAAG